MRTGNVYEWIRKEKRRGKLLLAAGQPLTAKQLARKTGIPANSCSYLLAKFTWKKLMTCLNAQARTSRLYGLTKFGISCRRQLHQEKNLPYCHDELPDINWPLYGRVCFSHREAVIRMLTEPLQPSALKRKLRLYRPHIKISANNIRDLVKWLLAEGIVEKIFIPKKAHPRYRLTDTGKQFRQLLLRADTLL